MLEREKNANRRKDAIPKGSANALKGKEMPNIKRLDVNEEIPKTIKVLHLFIYAILFV